MPSKYRGTPEEIKALTAYIALSRAASSTLHVTTAHLRDYGVTPSQFGVMDALYHLGSLNQRELSQKLLLSTGNMTAVLQNMERSGLINRQRGEEDQRSVTVSLTDKGTDLIEKILPGHVAGIVRTLAVLSPEELEILTTLCRKLGLQELATVDDDK